MSITLTSAEVELLKLLLRIDPGPLGLSGKQAATARKLLAKLEKGN